MRRKILTRENVPITDEENDTKTILFLLRQNEKINDILQKTTAMHETLAKILWQYKLRKKSNIMKIDSDSNSEIDSMDLS